MKQVYGNVNKGRKNMNIKQSKSRIAFLCINNILLAMLVVATVYPFLYIIFASFSTPNGLVAAEGIILRPQGFSIEAYKAVLKNSWIVNGYINTIFLVVVGTLSNLAMTIIAAYFYSRPNVMHKKILTLMMVFTMYFGGGLIPTYLLVRDLGLNDTLWALILPGLISPSYVIILRTAFYNIPSSLEESAKLDGAGHVRTLWSVILPLALPTIAVAALYYGVAYWNSWFSASIYIRDRRLYPLQLILQEILISGNTSRMDADTSLADKAMISENIKYAVVIIATVPILMFYPFIQKYFVKGVMVGAVKE